MVKNQARQFVAEDIETGKQITYQIVTDPKEADLRRRRIYIKAPIVQAWIHKLGQYHKS